MLSANSSALASASGLIFALNEAALARAEPDLAPAVSRAGDLVRLLERATRTIDLCGLCGILRVVLQILSMNPGAQYEYRTQSTVTDCHLGSRRLSDPREAEECFSAI